MSSADAWPYRMTRLKFARLLQIRRSGSTNMVMLSATYPDEFDDEDVVEMMEHFVPMRAELMAHGFAVFAVGDGKQRDQLNEPRRDPVSLLACWEAKPEAEQAVFGVLDIAQ